MSERSPKGTQVDLVIERFGGTIRDVQRATGLPYQTIQHWRLRTGWIPARHHETILRAARDNGVDLSADELVCPVAPSNAATP